jgi:UDPglucose 6-dehydrogenase
MKIGDKLLSRPIVGVLGLGKLGLPFALTLAASDADVLAWDSDPAVREEVKVGRTRLQEPYADSFLPDALLLTRPRDMLEHADVVFIVVPTPSLEGKFVTDYVEQAMKDLGPSRTVERCIVGVVSTVSPGACRDTLLPLARSLKQVLIYCPTLIALGSVIQDLRAAEVQIIGDENPIAANVVSAILRKVAPKSRPMIMSYESAEIAKLATNVFATLKINFANQIGRMCHERGANADDVVAALTAQSLIGHKAMTPGAGFGGPCLPRDGHAYAAAGGSLGAVTHAMNEEHLAWVRHLALGGLTFTELAGKTFAVLGRSYKTGTGYRIDSFGDRLAYELARGNLVEAHEAEADIVVLALPLVGLDLRGTLKPGARVIDLWRCHPYLADGDHDYVAFGAGNA